MASPQKPSITITLSPAQVDEILRAASQGRAPSLSKQISEMLAAPVANGGRDDSEEPRDLDGAPRELDGEPQDLDGEPRKLDREPRELDGAPRQARLGRYMPSDTEDPRLSRSLLRGLSMLTCFGPSGEERGIVEIAGELGMSPSTAHRYALTLVELGLLERCPTSRKYRPAGM